MILGIVKCQTLICHSSYIIQLGELGIYFETNFCAFNDRTNLFYQCAHKGYDREIPLLSFFLFLRFSLCSPSPSPSLLFASLLLFTFRHTTYMWLALFLLLLYFLFSLSILFLPLSHAEEEFRHAPALNSSHHHKRKER